MILLSSNRARGRSRRQGIPLYLSVPDARFDESKIIFDEMVRLVPVRLTERSWLFVVPMAYHERRI